MLQTDHSSRAQSPPPDEGAGVVLDTNAVLDWLVFRHPSCAFWSDWLGSGRVRLLSSALLEEELRHVLARGVGAAWQADHSALWATWREASITVPAPALAGAPLRLRCSDPDDQKFIDLALGHGARWLVSRDRAVLKLARRARPLGLLILTPEAWTAELSAR